MIFHLNYRALAVASVAAVIAACSATESTSVRIVPNASMSISASTIAPSYLPMPAGATYHVVDLSAGGFIFGGDGAGNSAPYVWTTPYTSTPTMFSDVRGVGGGGGANDLGDFRAGGSGYYQHNGSDWQFTGVANNGYTALAALDVNNSRNVVGYGSLNSHIRALWWTDATSQPVELPDPVLTGKVTESEARTLNNSGTVAGYVNEQVVSGRKTVTYQHAVIWTADAAGWHVTVLNDGGSTSTNYPFQMNDAGQIVGQSGSSVVIWSPVNGVYGNVTLVSATFGGGTPRIDQCGRVVGSTNATTPSKRRGWVWENGVTTELPMPSGAVATEGDWITTELATGRGIIAGGALPSGAQNSSASFVPVIWTLPGCP